MIRRYLQAIVRRQDVTDDLFQEVFLRAAKSLPRYEEQGKAQAYLLRIANRQAKNYFRRHAREVFLHDPHWTNCEPFHEQLPEQLFHRHENRDRVILAMCQLNDIQRHVLRLRFYQQLDFQAIADLLNCPRNTALSHCRRGLLQLKKILTDEGGDG